MDEDGRLGHGPENGGERSVEPELSVLRSRAMSIAVEAPKAARALLREACAHAHTRLDSRLSQLNFNDRSAYADMLARMSGPVSAYEGALTAGVAPALFGNWSG